MRDRSWGWWRLTWITLLYWLLVLLAWSAWALYQANKTADAFVRANPEYANDSYLVVSPVGFSWPLALALGFIPPLALLFLRLRVRPPPTRF